MLFINSLVTFLTAKRFQRFQYKHVSKHGTVAMQNMPLQLQLMIILSEMFVKLLNLVLISYLRQVLVSMTEVQGFSKIFANNPGPYQAVVDLGGEMQLLLKNREKYVHLILLA